MITIVGDGGALPALLEADGVPVTPDADVLIVTGPYDGLRAAAARGALLILRDGESPPWLLPGIDHLVYGTEAEAALAAVSAVRHPAAYRPIRAFAKLAARAAEHQRAT